MPGGQRQAINLEDYAKFIMVSQVPWTYFMRNWPRGQSQESVWSVIGREESHGGRTETNRRYPGTLAMKVPTA